MQTTKLLLPKVPWWKKLLMSIKLYALIWYAVKRYKMLPEHLKADLWDTNFASLHLVLGCCIPYWKPLNSDLFGCYDVFYIWNGLMQKVNNMDLGVEIGDETKPDRYYFKRQPTKVYDKKQTALLVKILKGQINYFTTYDGKQYRFNYSHPIWKGGVRSSKRAVGNSAA